MQRIFADRHKTGQLDLEASEMAIRSTVHQTGADALSELLRLCPPDDDHRHIPCTCGRVARYEGMRSRPILSVVGSARIERPYYLCPACHTGHFPADVELDIAKTDFSPGVRRMLAAVGGVAPFAQGRDQIKLLAGLEVTAKTVERTAEFIGEDIEIRQQQGIQRAKQLRLPTVAGPSIPYLYVQMDGTQVFVVKTETEGRPVEPQASRLPLAEVNSARCSHKPPWMRRAGLCAMRIPLPTSARSKLPLFVPNRGGRTAADTELSATSRCRTSASPYQFLSFPIKAELSARTLRKMAKA